MNDEIDYSKTLNPAQLEAVMHTDGPLLVFAGAGSGKTRVLTYRILHLIKSKCAREDEILAVTFTNKAAREMAQRVASLLNEPTCSVWVSTFHSTCVRILRAHATTLGYSREFAIYSRSESLTALKRVMKQQQVDPRHISPKSVLQEIDRAKNKYIDPESYRSLSTMQYDIDERIHELYRGYQEELQRSNAMDFGDLLCNTVSLFQIAPKILKHYQEKFRYILVDEYQDTNPVQYLLLQQICAASKNICVVGDDDQSIYAFRGASIDNILSFQNDYPEARSITLAQNYRSTKTILAVANAIIAKNQKRQEKKLFTENPEGEPITCYLADDERDEARFVAEKIREAAEQGIPFSDIAVFYRTNAQSRSLEESLTDSAIPFSLYGGLRFYERKEIRDLISYLKLLANPSDTESLLRIINTPTRGIGPSSIKKLQEIAYHQGSSLYDALQTAVSEQTLGKAANTKCRAFLEMIHSLQAEYLTVLNSIADGRATSTCLSQLLHLIAERSGYLDQLQKENSEESFARIENLDELYTVAQEFVISANEEGKGFAIQDFIDRTSLVSDLDNENTTKLSIDHDHSQPQGTVSMMTLHLAKGLEFRYAFLVGLEDGLLPHIRSLDSRADLEEERRLCYVGITRGKEKLYLSRCQTRSSQSRGPGWSSGTLSRFINDIPIEHTEDKGGFFESSWDEFGQERGYWQY